MKVRLLRRDDGEAFFHLLVLFLGQIPAKQDAGAADHSIYGEYKSEETPKIDPPSSITQQGTHSRDKQKNHKSPFDISRTFWLLAL